MDNESHLIRDKRVSEIRKYLILWVFVGLRDVYSLWSIKITYFRITWIIMQIGKAGKKIERKIYWNIVRRNWDSILHPLALCRLLLIRATSTWLPLMLQSALSLASLLVVLWCIFHRQFISTEMNCKYIVLTTSPILFPLLPFLSVTHLFFTFTFFYHKW